MSVDLGRLLEDSGAVLKGHFILTSGRHTDTYFEKFRVLERPDILSALCQGIAEEHSDAGVEAVAGPTTGGIIIAFEVARRLGVPAIYIENEAGAKTLRRGKTLPAGQRVLIVDDVLTTGRSLIESRDAIVGAGGQVVAFAALIDRAEVAPDLGAPIYAAFRVQATSYPPDSLPPFLAAIPARKPGTRA